MIFDAPGLSGNDTKTDSRRHTSNHQKSLRISTIMVKNILRGSTKETICSTTNDPSNHLSVTMWNVKAANRDVFLKLFYVIPSDFSRRYSAAYCRTEEKNAEIDLILWQSGEQSQCKRGSQNSNIQTVAVKHFSKEKWFRKRHHQSGAVLNLSANASCLLLTWGIRTLPSGLWDSDPTGVMRPYDMLSTLTWWLNERSSKQRIWFSNLIQKDNQIQISISIHQVIRSCVVEPVPWSVNWGSRGRVKQTI